MRRRGLCGEDVNEGVDMRRKPLFIVLAVMALAVVAAVKIGFFDALLVSSSFQASKERAEQGDAKAQLELGRRYYHGAGIEKDGDQALVWFLKSAEQYNPEAMRLAGLMYNNGQASVQDPKLALHWLEAAYDASDNMAAYFIGQMYQQGEGVEKNLNTAYSWYQKGADRADSWSQWALGNLNQSGFDGHPVDLKSAVKWYRLSAKLGNELGQHEMGRMYNHGIGVEQDLGKAEMWYRRASEQGYWLASNNLAWLLATAKGSGVRNGKAALKVIEGIDLAELDDLNRAMVLDTFAAAYAEMGRFVDAVMAQEKVIALQQQIKVEPTLISESEARLHAYQQKQAWRE